MIVVQFAALAQGSADIAGTVSKMNSDLADLHSRLQGTIADWDGDARASYDVCKATWDSAATNIAEALAKLGSGVSSCGEMMAAAEARNVNRFC